MGEPEDLLRWLNEGIRAASEAVNAIPPDPVLRPPPPGTVLLGLQAEAVAVVLDGHAASSATGGGPGPVLAEIGTYLLGQEQTSWRPSGGAFGGDAEFELRVVCLLTLLGAGNEDEAAELLRRVPDLADATEERRRSLARWVRGLYPGDIADQWVGQLEPDLLAHALYATVFGDDECFTARLVDPEPSPAQVTRALHGLVPGTATFPTLTPVAAPCSTPAHCAPSPRPLPPPSTRTTHEPPTRCSPST